MNYDWGLTDLYKVNENDVICEKLMRIQENPGLLIQLLSE